MQTNMFAFNILMAFVILGETNGIYKVVWYGQAVPLLYIKKQITYNIHAYLLNLVQNPEHPYLKK